MAASEGSATAGKPLHIGVCLFQGFEMLDFSGPMEVFNDLAYLTPLKLSLLATSLEPVSTTPAGSMHHPFGQSVVPTHTYTDPPKDLDVVMVPGGRGVYSPQPQIIEFLKQTYPTLRYLLSVCNGADLLAQAGLLDGRKATTNKKLFKSIAERYPTVDWQPKARWVVDGNVWTSSGVAAGIDQALGWVATVYSEEWALKIADGSEYEWHRDSSHDVFAEKYGL